jgi:hypothetical protein
MGDFKDNAKIEEFMEKIQKLFFDKTLVLEKKNTEKTKQKLEQVLQEAYNQIVKTKLDKD